MKLLHAARLDPIHSLRNKRRGGKEGFAHPELGTSVLYDILFLDVDVAPVGDLHLAHHPGSHCKRGIVFVVQADLLPCEGWDLAVLAVLEGGLAEGCRRDLSVGLHILAR